ncbi:MAG: DUF4136 domain-containing protein [Nitrospira sp.]|nr:DUF4136 domain-containing protein [Nitrospira sp.]
MDTRMNRRRSVWPLILLMLGLSACTTFDVKTDHDPTADFTTFRTFTFVGLAEAEKGGIYDNSLKHKRIESAVARELIEKGLQQVDLNQQPDLLVYYWFSTKEKQQIQSTGPTAGAYRGRYGYGWGAGYGGTVTTYDYTEGTLTLDLVEPTKKELVWRATIVGTLKDTAKDNIELGNKAIAKAFESYPPKRS